MNLSNSYYAGISDLHDQSPIQDEGTIVVEADVNIQWYNAQPKKFNLFFDGQEQHHYLHASLLTTQVITNGTQHVKVFSIGY